MNETVRRVHALLSGRVQGVWFRKTTLEQASTLGLSGYVRNLDDGRVELEAEGPGDQVDEFVSWVQHGPPKAHVEKVVLHPAEPLGETEGFHLRK